LPYLAWMWGVSLGPLEAWYPSIRRC
jgi:hypothetical protein